MKTWLFKEKNNLISLFFLVLITSLAYWKIFSIFYQQDEWLSLGRALLVKKPIDIFEGLNFVKIILGKGRFIPFGLGYLFFIKFPFNALPFAAFSLFFHILNTLLVYGLAKKFLRSYVFSFIAATFFAVNSVSSNSVSWFGTSLGTLPAVTFVFLAIFSFFEYLKKKKRTWLILTFLLLYFSLFFKEIAVPLFLLLPVASLLFRKEKIKEFFFTYWLFFGFFILNTALRVYEIRTLPQDQTALFLTGASANYWQSLLMRAVLYPLTSFSLSFIPPIPFLEFSRFITRIYYPFIPPDQFILTAQTSVLDLLSLFLTFIIFWILLTISKKFSKTEKSLVYFWAGFTLASFLPYIIISKNFSYLESRYYYLSSASVGIIFALIVRELIKQFKKVGLKMSLGVLCILFLFWHTRVLYKDLQIQVDVSQERVSFLNQLSLLKPSLSGDKTVFFITSDADYYLVGNKVPFQQGTGYTLMMWYYDSGKIPPKFLKDGFLYNLATQGYEEDGGLGFGYYWDKDLLDKELKQKKFSKENIVPLHYDSSAKILSKIPL